MMMDKSKACDCGNCNYDIIYDEDFDNFEDGVSAEEYDGSKDNVPENNNKIEESNDFSKKTRLFCLLCGKSFYVSKDSFLFTDEEDLICPTCTSKYHKELHYTLIQGSKRDNHLINISNSVRRILESLSNLYGIDPDDENFKGTPFRVLRMLLEMNYGTNNKAAEDILKSASFPSNYSGLISSNNIKVSSTCPHHMVVVDYEVHVAYVPSRICVGLSKLPRVAKVMAKSMKLQEDYTHELAQVINDTIQPAGVGVIVNGIHICISARGAEMKGIVNSTSSLTGVFMSNPTLRSEWLELIKIQKAK